MAEPREKQPWERQKGEGHKAYAAFSRYRDLGPARSVGKAAPVTARDGMKTARQRETHWWRQWAQKWAWRARAEAWDDYQVAIRQRAADEVVVATAIATAEENERQRGLTIDTARAIKAAVRAVLARFLSDTKSLEQIPSAKLVPFLNIVSQAAKAAQVVERLEMGEATNREEHRIAPETAEAAKRVAAVLEDARAHGYSVGELVALLDEMGNGKAG